MLRCPMLQTDGGVRYGRRQWSLYTENRDILCITGLKSERKKHIKNEDYEDSYRIRGEWNEASQPYLTRIMNIKYFSEMRVGIGKM